MVAQTGMPWAQTTGDPDVLTVRGKVTAQVYENPETSYRVLRVETEEGKTEVWVGTMPPVHTGMVIAGVGRYEPDPRRPGEERFGILSVQPEVPRTAEGIREYLGSGAFPGIGPALADRIVGLFGERTVDVLDQEPQRLLEIPGIGPKIHGRFLEAWVENRRVSEIMIFLVGHGASGALAQRIYEHYGARAIEQIQQNPFKLARDVAGIGFKTADRIARACGLALDSPDRDAAGILEVLSRAEEDGHTYLALRDAIGDAQKLLETEDVARPEEAVLAAVEQLHTDRLVFRDKIPACGEILLRAELALVERAIARRISELLAVPAALPDLGPGAPPPPPLAELAGEAIRTFEQQASFELAPAQRQAVELAARSKLMILTGGPGVGKTTIVKTILWLFRQAKIQVRLCAPTGRAAQRMRETTGGDAMTIHRMLGRDMENRKEFFYRADRPLPCEAMIIDECSMIDVSLARSLLEALPDRARVIFVGDVDQLPSVGPGAVLRDLIDSQAVPTVRLTTIFRQAEGSLIITNAHRINAGEMPETASFPGGEFHLIERQSEEEAAKTVLRVVTERIPERFRLDPLHDVQVLVPMHKGPAGTILLNRALQEALNPPGSAEIAHGGGELGPTIYRLGDKVMQTVNDVNQDVYNGDIGFIVEVSPDNPDRTIIARFEDREAVYPRNKLRQLKHAYATTVHKCVHPDTLVETQEGLLPIGRIRGRGTIGAPMGAVAYGNRVRYETSPLHTIQTRGGYRLAMTPNHGIDVWSGHGYIRRDAASLRPGDIVRLRLGVTCEPLGNVPLPPPPPADVRARRYRFPTKMTADLAEFFGLMVADGCLFRRGMRLVKRHQDVGRRFARLARKLFGARPKPISILDTPGYEICSTQIADWLRLVGGMAPKAKAVPMAVLRSPSAIHAAFLRGLFEDGSAHFNRRGRVLRFDHVEWSTAIPALESTVRTMLLRLGIISGTVSTARQRKVTLYGAHAVRFAKLVGFVARFKNGRLQHALSPARSRYWIPLGCGEIACLRAELPKHFSQNDKQNALRYCRISRPMAERLRRHATGTLGQILDERLAYHHEPIVRIVNGEGPASCVAVPRGHQFFQNGFSGWNSQGSEYRAVVVVMLQRHFIMLSRKLLYTAVTRGKRLVVLVADPRALRTALGEMKREDRRTTLAYRLAKETGR